MKRLWKWVRALFGRGRETSTVEPLSEAEMKFKMLLDYEIRKAQLWYTPNERKSEHIVMGGVWREQGNHNIAPPTKVDIRRYLLDYDSSE